MVNPSCCCTFCCCSKQTKLPSSCTSTRCKVTQIVHSFHSIIKSATGTKVAETNQVRQLATGNRQLGDKSNCNYTCPQGQQLKRLQLSLPFLVFLAPLCSDLPWCRMRHLHLQLHCLPLSTGNSLRNYRQRWQTLSLLIK